VAILKKNTIDGDAYFIGKLNCDTKRFSEISQPEFLQVVLYMSHL